MTYKKGKQQFTKEEIIEILRRNVNLFKDEEEFVDLHRGACALPRRAPHADAKPTVRKVRRARPSRLGKWAD